MSRYSQNYKYCSRSRTYRSKAQLNAISRSYSAKHESEREEIIDAANVRMIFDYSKYKTTSMFLSAVGTQAWCKAVKDAFDSMMWKWTQYWVKGQDNCEPAKKIKEFLIFWKAFEARETEMFLEIIPRVKARIKEASER